MSKMKGLLLFLLTFTVCKKETYNNKATDMKENIGFVGKGNSSIDINIKDAGLKDQVLFFNNNLIVIGKDSIPNSLVVDPKADISEFPSDILNHRKQITKVFFKSLIISDTFNYKFQSIAYWLTDFENLSYLQFDDIKLEGLNSLKNPSLKYLVLSNVSINNRDETISEIAKLKSLKYISHSNLFTLEEIAKLKGSLPNVNILLGSDFDQKVEIGEIDLM